MGKKRRGEWVARVGARAATGERSRIVTIKVPATKKKTDVYVFFEVEDMKFSIHDPALSVERPPWQLNVTDKHFVGEAPPLREPEHRLVSAWGPIGEIPQWMYAALQILMPVSELLDRRHQERTPADVTWIEPLSDGDVAFLLLLYAPSPTAEPSFFRAPKGLKEIGRRLLRNGRQLIVCGGISKAIPAFWRILEMRRAQGQRLILDDIASGETSRLDDGLNQFDGYFPLGGQPCQTLVELKILSYVDLAHRTPAS